MGKRQRSGISLWPWLGAASMGLACHAAVAQGVAQGVARSEFRTMFQDVVLKHEYEGSALRPLLRWEVPVHLSVSFGASVQDKDRAADLKSIRVVTRTIAATTGHDISVTKAEGNFHVYVVSGAELAALGPTLQSTVGLSESSALAISRTPRNTNCLVVALPERDKTKGYHSAVAIVRSDAPQARRESCFYEEIGQGMGLPNDCRERMTVFNDDDEFAHYTAMDLAMMRAVYDHRLTSGMMPEVVMRLLDEILASNS